MATRTFRAHVPDDLADKVDRLADVVVEHAAGRPVSEAPLLDYLDAKFGAIYGL